MLFPTSVRFQFIPNPPDGVVAVAERGIRNMEERLSRWILDSWRQWPVCGGSVEPLTEGQDAAGDARWPVWREFGGRWGSWWVGVRSVGRLPTAPSGWEWKGAQSREGATELGFPGPTLWQMQSEAARLAGEPSGDREEPSPEGLVGHHRLAQTDARGPAGQQLCWLSSRMGNFCGTRTTPWRAILDHRV